MLRAGSLCRLIPFSPMLLIPISIVHKNQAGHWIVDFDKAVDVESGDVCLVIESFMYYSKFDIQHRPTPCTILLCKDTLAICRTDELEPWT